MSESGFGSDERSVLFVASSVILLLMGGFFSALVVALEVSHAVALGISMGALLGINRELRKPISGTELKDLAFYRLWIAVSVGYFAAFVLFGFTVSSMVFVLAFVIPYRYFSGARPVVLFLR